MLLSIVEIAENRNRIYVVANVDPWLRSDNHEEQRETSWHNVSFPLVVHYFDPLPCTLTVRYHPWRKSLKHFPDRIYRRIDSETGGTSVNRIVLHVLGVLGGSCGWWRRLWTILLRRIRGTTPERRDAVGASPIRSLGCVHVGCHAGNTAAATSAARSRPRRSLATVQGWS